MKEQLLELIFPPRCAVCTEVLDMEERRGILCHDWSSCLMCRRGFVRIAAA